MNFFKHLKTVTRHRRTVRKLCFKCGLIRQGLMHALSKFSRAEFNAGVKYYQGNRSPQAREREVVGYSAAWLHHKGKNKHHFEYWTDNGLCDGIVPVEMPPKYFAEMVCDRIAASKIYNGKNYNDACPLEYFEARNDGKFMHPNTSEKLLYFLKMLKDEGEDKTLKELKKFVKESKGK